VAINLISDLLDQFRGATLTGVASALGESPTRTQAALGAVIPAAIGALVARASNADQANGILEMITRNQFDSAESGDVSTAVKAPGGISNLMNLGGPLLSQVFGSRSDAVIDLVASHSGVSRASSSSLVKLALPLILGLIGRYVRSAGWSATNLMTLLGEQRAFLKDAPPGFADIMGTEDRPTVRPEPVPRAAAAVYGAAPSRTHRWLWALPILFLIPVLGFLMGRDYQAPREAVQATLPPPPPGFMPITPVPDRPVGTSSEPVVPFQTGPFRIQLSAGARGVSKASADELRKVVEILEAHPRARAEVIGFTDNRGRAAVNNRLSEHRAAIVASEIASHGISRSRLTVRGFGGRDPIADNATPEGRELNQRVEIRLQEE